MAPKIEMLQQVYDAIESEESVIRHLKESHLDETLQNLVQWVPQNTRQSAIESVRLMGIRCSELEKEIEYVLCCHVMHP